MQEIATNGIKCGVDELLGLDTSIYTLNINDFDFNEDSLSLYHDTMILMDKKGSFTSLKNENNSYKKVRTML